jgi:hypothetical protein
MILIPGLRINDPHLLGRAHDKYVNIVATFPSEIT